MVEISLAVSVTYTQIHTHTHTHTLGLPYIHNKQRGHFPLIHCEKNICQQRKGRL